MVKNKKDDKSDNNEQIEVKNLLLEIKATMDNLGYFLLLLQRQQ